MGFLRRRAEKRELQAAAVQLRPSIEALRNEIEAGSSAVRAEFEDLPGFPPACERCDRVMTYRRIQLSRKKWRWMWHCSGCGHNVYDAALKAAADGS